jgi:hypothetical protein
MQLASNSSNCAQGMNISIIYNAFIRPETNWRMIIKGQIHDLVASGLPSYADVHVSLSAPASHPGLTYIDLENLLAEGEAYIHGQPSGGMFKVVAPLENAMEYPGLQSLWLLAQDDDHVAARSW